MNNSNKIVNSFFHSDLMFKFTVDLLKMKILYFFTLLFLLNSCDTMPVANTIYRPTTKYPQNAPLSNNENAEFSALLEKDQINKKRVNAEVLTYLLNDPDPAEKSTAAVIENSSRCDIIVRLVGIKNNHIYNLPIPRNSKNQFVIDKGTYTLKSKICGANYYSQKDIKNPLLLKLSSN